LDALFTQGHLGQAEAAARNLADRYSHIHYLRMATGRALGQMGRLGEALEQFQRALDLAPEDPETVFHVANTHAHLGNLEAARDGFTRALELRPDVAVVWGNLGATLGKLGDNVRAVECFRRAIAIDPDLASAHNNIGLCLAQLGHTEEARISYERALVLDPDFTMAHCNLGATLAKLGRSEAAVASFRKTLAIDPRFTEARVGLAAVLGLLGRFTEAEDELRLALRYSPNHCAAHSNLLMCMNYSGRSAETRLDEARRYGRIVAAHAAAPFASWRCPSAPMRLRVGFVSGDLRDHAVGYFLESVLANLDGSRIELYAYPTHPAFDALSARIRPYFREWRPLVHLDDEGAARRIHADGIHLLLDLSGHTADNRLPVFAWRPAPVQATWLGYFATSGVEQIDWLVADPWCVPDGHEGQFTERIWRLPETRMCFTAPRMEIRVADLPAPAAGLVTYGCFNNLAKMNDAVVAVWSAILREVPASRLFLKARQLDDGPVRDSVRERFRAHGVAPERLLLEGQSSREQYLNTYHRVDIALDPFPFPGGATSAEALWMGVPVIALAGDCLIARQGYGMLMNAGLADWIAEDTADYARRAVHFASDLQMLAKLRSTLREQVLGSPLFDAARFARHFEAALSGMWAAAQVRLSGQPDAYQG